MATWTKHPGGKPARLYPIDPVMMARTCRKLARDLRAEAALGKGPVSLTHTNGEAPDRISRAEAARRMDLQAERWEREARTGEKNDYDRSKL